MAPNLFLQREKAVWQTKKGEGGGEEEDKMAITAAAKFWIELWQHNFSSQNI
jgi:hypothetical protein